MNLKDMTLGFIGGGAMAEAILGGVVNSNLLSPDSIVVSDPNSSRLSYLVDTWEIKGVSSNEKVAAEANIIILAVKPPYVKSVLQEIKEELREGQLIISIAAGVSLEVMEEVTSLKKAIAVRVMPNTPCLIGQGASAISLGELASEAHGFLVEEIFKAVGIAVVVPETLMDCVTGLSGSGPAYVYIMLEAMIDGAVKMGLPRDIATKLAAQTMVGGAQMVLETAEQPMKLKDQVTTPGGTTIEGIFALENGNIRATLMKAVEAATNKSKEMAKKQ